jgi:hypothetical protein
LRAGFPLISLSLHLSHLPSPRPIPSFSFLPRRKLFTRRILVVQDESGGYLLSIDRFWQHAKSFWPSLRGLTSPFIYPSFSFSLSLSCPSSVFRTFFTAVLISFSIPNRPAITSLARLFFFYRSDAFPLSPCAVFDGCFLVFPVFPFYLCIPFSLVILSRESSVHFTLSFSKRFALECPWKFASWTLRLALLSKSVGISLENSLH